jgi:hypothetical protein
MSGAHGTAAANRCFDMWCGWRGLEALHQNLNTMLTFGASQIYALKVRPGSRCDSAPKVNFAQKSVACSPPREVRIAWHILRLYLAPLGVLDTGQIAKIRGRESTSR